MMNKIYDLDKSSQDGKILRPIISDAPLLNHSPFQSKQNHNIPNNNLSINKDPVEMISIKSPNNSIIQGKKNHQQMQMQQQSLKEKNYSKGNLLTHSFLQQKALESQSFKYKGKAIERSHQLWCREKYLKTLILKQTHKLKMEKARKKYQIGRQQLISKYTISKLKLQYKYDLAKLKLQLKLQQKYALLNTCRKIHPKAASDNLAVKNLFDEEKKQGIKVEKDVHPNVGLSERKLRHLTSQEFKYLKDRFQAEISMEREKARNIRTIREQWRRFKPSGLKLKMKLKRGRPKTKIIRKQ